MASNVHTTFSGDPNPFKRALGVVRDSTRQLSGELGTMLSRVTSGLATNAISSAFSQASAAATGFFHLAAEESKKLADSQRFLASAIRETGGSLAEARGEAKAFALAFGTTTSDAQRLFAQATLSLDQAGNPANADTFLRRFADAAAARGRQISELPTLISSLFTDDATADKILGKNPSGVYAEYAAALGRTASSLSDVEKKQALVNAILEVGEKNTGAASDRMKDFGGQVEQITSLMADFAGKVGEALARNEGVQKVVGGIKDFLVRMTTDTAAFEAALRKVGPAIQTIGVFFVDVAAGAQKAFATAKFALAEFQNAAKIVGLGVASIFVQAFADVSKTVGDVMRGILFLFNDTFQQIQGGLDGALAAAQNIPDAIGGRGIRADLERAKTVVAAFQFSLDSGAKGLESISAKAGDFASTLRGQVGEAVRQVGSDYQNYQIELQGVDNWAKAAYRSVEAFGKFAEPKSAIDAMGEAAAQAAAKFEKLSTSVKAATEAQGKLLDKRLASLSEIADIDARIAQLTNPEITYTQKTGKYGQQVDEFDVSFAYAAERTEDRVRRAFDDFDRALAATTGPGAKLQAAQGLAAFLASTDPGAIDRAGLLPRYVEILKTVRDDKAKQDQELAKSQRDLAEELKKNTEELKLAREAKEKTATAAAAESVSTTEITIVSTVPDTRVQAKANGAPRSGPREGSGGLISQAMTNVWHDVDHFGETIVQFGE